MVEPSASTAGRWRTSALRFAMRCVAMASDSVTVGSRPSGTLATMMPMANSRFSQNGRPSAWPMRKNTPPMPRGEHGDDAGQPRDLALQRRGDRARRLRQVGDLAELGVHAGGEHHGARLARHHRGAGQQRCSSRCSGDSSGWASASRALGSDSPVIVAVLTRRPKASISRQSAGTSSPSSSSTMSPGTSSLASISHDLAVAQHLHLLRQQLAQRGERPLGPVFLPEGEDAVDQDDADDGDAQPRHALAGVEVFGEKRQRRGQPQDEGEEVGELAGEAQQQALAPDFLDMVRAELRQASLRLGRSQARGRGVQAGERLLCGEALDVHRENGRRCLLLSIDGITECSRLEISGCGTKLDRSVTMAT